MRLRGRGRSRGRLRGMRTCAKYNTAGGARPTGVGLGRGAGAGGWGLGLGAGVYLCEVQHGRGCAADDALEEGAKVDLVRIRGRVRVRVRVWRCAPRA